MGYDDPASGSNDSRPCPSCGETGSTQEAIPVRQMGHDQAERCSSCGTTKGYKPHSAQVSEASV